MELAKGWSGDRIAEDSEFRQTDIQRAAFHRADRELHPGYRFRSEFEHLPGGSIIATTAACTIVLSILAHGISAKPLIGALRTRLNRAEEKLKPTGSKQI